MSSRNKSTLPLVEDFLTLQGEGLWAGCAAWFIRLGGCDVGCRWCDSPDSRVAANHPQVAVDEIVRRAAAQSAKIVIITGGEPLLHPLDELCEKLHAQDMRVHLETSGSHPFSGTFDHICLSPKPQRSPLDEAWARADELKVIVETPEDLLWAEQCAAKTISAQAAITAASCTLTAPASPPKTAAATRAKAPTQAAALFLQPEWSRRREITPIIVEYIKQNPRWRLSLQTHKYIDIP